MARQLISSGSALEAEYGYSRAVVDGDWVFVSGTTGMDYKTGDMPEGIAEQAEQTFRNIEAALTEAGAAMAEILRYRIFVTDPAEVPLLAPVAPFDQPAFLAPAVALGGLVALALLSGTAIAAMGGLLLSLFALYLLLVDVFGISLEMTPIGPR